MKYYKLLLDNSNGNDIFAYCDNIMGINQYALMEGKVIKNWNRDVLFFYNPNEGDRYTDYLANDLGWFIVSERLKNILQQLDDNIQYFPIKIVNKLDKTQFSEYYVANILNVVSALNLEKSKYDLIEAEDIKIYSVSKYALNSNALNNLNIIKLKGDELPVFVSEILKEYICENNLTGCDFLEIKIIDN
ncbi:imm11 family protein [Ureibacillus composti]